MPAKRCSTRFRGAIFRSMAASWAPNEEPACLARESIDSLHGSRSLGSQATKVKRRSAAKKTARAMRLSREDATQNNATLFGSPSFGHRLPNCGFGKLSMAGGNVVLQSHPRVFIYTRSYDIAGTTDCCVILLKIPFITLAEATAS